MRGGLGKMQQLILASLEDARHRYEQRHGRAGGLSAYGYNIWLAPGVYDLRVTLTYVARTVGGVSHGPRVSQEFRSSFSRAARTLAGRGLLERLEYVPVVRWRMRHPSPQGGQIVTRRMGDCWLREPDDGEDATGATFLAVPEGQLRFVRRPST
jgi:hypothetical protein